MPATAPLSAALTEPGAHPPTTMSAIVADRYGSPDVLRLATVAVPRPGPTEVLVRVRAAGVDRGTMHLLTGTPYLMRLMGFGLRAPKDPVAGRDLAGTVVEVGSAVTHHAVGDAVMGTASGSFAEYAVADERKLAAKPASLTWEQAAVVPISAVTALQALDTGRVEPGARVLVIGASGGVGSFAVQLAHTSGADVTAVCRGDKADFVRGLGAGRVIDYTDEDVTGGSPAYDVIIDIGGNTPLRTLRNALASRGTLVIVGGESKGDVTGGFGRQLRAVVLSMFVRQRLTMLVSRENATDIERLSGLLAAGTVVPAVDRAFPLAAAPDALRRLGAGEVRGKQAIVVRAA